MYEVGTGFEFGIGIGFGGDAANADDGDFFREGGGEGGERVVGFFEDRFSGEAASFVGEGVGFDQLAVEGGVGGDEAFEAAVEEDFGEVGDLFIAEVRCDFEKDGDVFAVLGAEFLLGGFQ